MVENMNLKNMIDKKVKKMLIDHAINKIDKWIDKKPPEGYLNLFNTGLKIELKTIRKKAGTLARTLIENYRRKI
jgi:hypothetical protein